MSRRVHFDSSRGISQIDQSPSPAHDALNLEAEPHQDLAIDSRHTLYTLKNMAPTIHLVRHAQGYHNLTVENESIHDPDLTPLGETQCANVRDVFVHHDKLTRLVASPLRRTLNTCIAAFGTDNLYPILALDLLQEVSASPCDTGSDPLALTEEFGDKVEVRGLGKGTAWTDKGPDSKFAPTVEKLTARAKEARRAMRSLAGDLGGNDHIAVVTHGGFLHFLTDDWYGIPSTAGMFLSVNNKPLSSTFAKPVRMNSHWLGEL